MLLQYVDRTKNQSVVERSFIQGEHMLELLQLPGLFRGRKSESGLRPQNIIRFFEKALKAHKQLLVLEKESLDPSLHAEYDFEE